MRLCCSAEINGVGATVVMGRVPKERKLYIGMDSELDMGTEGTQYAKSTIKILL